MSEEGRKIELSGTAFIKVRKRGFEILEGWEDRAILPRRQTGKSAGYDLHSAVDTLVPAHGYVLVDTGLTAYMRSDEELQIRPRSGLALKQGITCLNSPGTIDADYYDKKGHIRAILYNVTREDYFVNKGDRIAQAVFANYLIADNDDPVSESRDGGFGHTGR